MLNENLWSQLAHCSFTKHGRHTRAAAGFKMSALSLHLSEHFNNSLFMQYKKTVQLSILSPFSAFALPILSMGIRDTPRSQILDSDMCGPKPPPTPDKLSLGKLSCFLGRCNSKRHFSKEWKHLKCNLIFCKDVSLGTRSQLQESWNKFECFMKCRLPTLRVMKILKYSHKSCRTGKYSN